MKIVHVCCVAPPQIGGMGLVVDKEVSYLRNLGVDAVLVAPQAPVDKAEQPDYVVRLPAWRIGHVARLFGLQSLLSDADVVHLHYPFYFTAGLLAGWRRRNKIKRLVITLHMDAMDKGWRGWVAEVHRKFLQKQVLKSVDLLLVSTRDYAEHSSYAVWGDDPKLHELPFGVESADFSPGPSAKAEFGLPEQARVVGTVSAMDRAHPFKGVDILVRAMVDLPEDVHALLVGEGDRRADYQALAKDLGLAHRVHFSGRLEPAKLVKALRSMDVFAFPSTSTAEAFGLAVLEAMSCGVPVVASDLPGVRRVADQAGLLVLPGNQSSLSQALLTLLNDAGLRSKFSQTARAKAVLYDWREHAQKLIAFYQKLCA